MKKLLVGAFGALLAPCIFATPSFGPHVYSYGKEASYRYLDRFGTETLPVVFTQETAYIPVILAEGDKPITAKDVVILSGSATKANLGTVTVRSDADLYKELRVAEKNDEDTNEDYFSEPYDIACVYDDTNETEWAKELWEEAGEAIEARTDRQWIAVPLKGNNGPRIFKVGLAGTDVVSAPIYLCADAAAGLDTKNAFRELAGKITVPEFISMDFVDHAQAKVTDNTNATPYTAYQFGSKNGDGVIVKVAAPEAGTLVVAAAVATDNGLTVKQGSKQIAASEVSESDSDRLFAVYNQPDGAPIYRVPLEANQTVTIAEPELWEGETENGFMDYVYLSRLLFFPKDAQSVAILASTATMLEATDSDKVPYSMGFVKGTGVYKAGERVSLEAVSHEGATFDHWEVAYSDSSDTLPEWLLRGIGDAGAKLSFDVPPAICGKMAEEKALVIRAVWKQNQVAFTRTSPIGLTTLSGDGFAIQGEAIALTAPEKVTDSKKKTLGFVGWVDADGAAITPDEDAKAILATAKTLQDYIATYTEQTTKVVLKLEVNDEDGGSVSGAKDYLIGQSASIKATPKAGYVFAGWTLADNTDITVGTPADPKNVDAPYITVDPRNAALTVGLPNTFAEDAEINPTITLKAWFVEKDSDDTISQNIVLPTDLEAGVAMTPTKLDISSSSLPVVSVTGLPKGITLDAKTLTLSGTPAMPGDYEVSFTITNASVSRTNALKVVDIPLTVAPSSAIAATDFVASVIPGVVQDASIPSLVDCTISGLPAGLKWDAKKGTLTGAATKPGEYDLTLTKKEGKNTYVATATIIVEDLRVLNVVGYAADDGDITTATLTATRKHKVTGEGEYVAGKKVTLKATPASKDYVFAGWVTDPEGTPAPLAIEGVDYRQASISYTVPEDAETTIGAIFIKKSLDNLTLTVDCTPAASYPAGVAATIPVTVTSATFPTVSVTAKNLPTGMKFDAKALAIVGTPTKPGTYEDIVFTAVNTSLGKSEAVESAPVTIVIGDFADFDLQLQDTVFALLPGEQFEADIPAAEGCTVSGLPAGVKWDAKKTKLSGAATRAGEYVAVFSKRVTIEKKTVTQKASVLFLIDDELPTLTVSSDVDGCKVTPATAKGYAVGSKVTLRATPAKGYVFAGWTKNGQPLENAVDYRQPSLTYVTTIEDTEIVAQFIPEDWNDTCAIENVVDPATVWPGDKLEGAKLFTVDAKAMPTVTVKNLPAGLKFDAKSLTVSGAATKPGTYRVTATATVGKGAAALIDMKQFEVVVKDLPAVEPQVAIIAPDADDPTLNTVSVPRVSQNTVKGAGFYAVGKKVSLSAKAAKDYTFLCWGVIDENGDFQPLLSDAGDLITATTYSYTVPAEELSTVTALFAKKSNDTFSAENGLVVSVVEKEDGANADTWDGDDDVVSLALKAALDPELSGIWAISRYTEATVAVKGLPTGLKLNTKDGSLSGAPTKPGLYEVTVTATNKSGNKATWTVPFKVSNIDELLTGTDEIAYTVGKDDAKVVLDDAFKGAKVTGLPKGVKWDAEKATLSGLTWATGSVTLTFTKDGKTTTVTLKLQAQAPVLAMADTLNGLVEGQPCDIYLGDASAFYATSKVSFTVKCDGKALPSGLKFTTETDSWTDDDGEVHVWVGSRLTGVAPKAGTYEIEVSAKDSATGLTSTATTTLTVGVQALKSHQGTFYATLESEDLDGFEDCEAFVVAKIVRDAAKGTATLQSNGLTLTTLPLVDVRVVDGQISEVYEGYDKNDEWVSLYVNEDTIGAPGTLAADFYFGRGSYTDEGISKAVSLADYNKATEQEIEAGTLPIDEAIYTLPTGGETVKISGSYTYTAQGTVSFELAITLEGFTTRTVKGTGAITVDGIIAVGTLDETLGLGKMVALAIENDLTVVEDAVIAFGCGETVALGTAEETPEPIVPGALVEE